MTVKTNLVLGAYPSRPDRERSSSSSTCSRASKERLRQRAGTLERRRAADAGGGSGAHVAAAGPDARRADHRPRAEARASRVRRRSRASRATGLTLLIAEQQVPLALSVADRGYVLENGRIRLEGHAAELEQNPEVRRAYLGVASRGRHPRRDRARAGFGLLGVGMTLVYGLGGVLNLAYGEIACSARSSSRS